MAKPANPAIIIGMGGTGQWVLTYVKKNLLDTYGEKPETVKLLAFDTTSEQTEAKVEKGEEHAKVGNVQLDASEFVYLGGNIRNIANEIKRDATHPHISSWFQAETYLKSFDDDAFELSKGAGQRRPFGRMAVFYDLMQSPSQIINKIEQAITDVKSKNDLNLPIEIYLVCSLAGGTGSGMFLDIAHITRQLAELGHVSFAIRAFLVLQNTFQPVIDINQILANSFAATRELDRFLLVFDRDYPIYYSDDKSQRKPPSVYRSIYHSKLFDNCYLLDARRKNIPLDGVKPWSGVFPAAAECITALLDPETGDTFAQHYKNVNNRLAEKQKEIKKALYSSLGTFTYILPVEDILETITHRAALELVGERLFKIKESEHTSTLSVTAESQDETRVTSKDAAINFYKLDKTTSGEQNVPFLQQMQLTLEGGRLDDREYISQLAVRGIELLSWLKPVETDQAINSVSESIQSIIDASLNVEVTTSDVEKDDFHAGADRIFSSITKFREKKLGYEEVGGKRAPGELQKGLAEYADRNRKRFRRVLAQELSNILNGMQSDPVKAKSGKLPYAQELLGWMLKAIDEFDGFMKRVWTYRAESNEMALARDDVTRTKQIMYDNRDRTGFLDRFSKPALHSQEDYIRAEDYLFSLEREDVLYRAVMDYSAMFRKIVEDAKAQLDNWAQILTLGGPVNSDEAGAYKILQNQKAEITRRRQEQTAVRVYEYLTDERFENDLYNRQVNYEKWGEIMRLFRWEFGFLHEDQSTTSGMEDGQIQYRYRWEKDKETDFVLRLYYGQDQLASSKTRQTSASQINARFLIDNLRPYFLEIRNETIADRLTEYRTANSLAVDMINNSGAMIQFPSERQSSLEKHNFVCINRGRQIKYVEELEEGLRANAKSDKDNQVIGLTNKHRAIVLSTVDLIIGEATDPIISSRKTYLEHTGDHRLLHNFPADVNASWYEDRIPRTPINEARRLLDPTLVALLEDREMMRRYILARVFGLINEEKALHETNKNQYIMRLDRVDRRDFSSVICLTRPVENPTELDAMTNFVFVKIDKDTGVRHILDVTPDTNIQIEPWRVDEAIQIRMDAILSGRDVAVKEFDKLLKENSSLLNTKEPQARQLLVGAFRKFMMTDYESYNRDKKLGSTASLDRYITNFLDANRDTIMADAAREDAVRKIISSEINTLLEKTSNEIKPQTNAALVRILEDYIDQTVTPLRRSEDQLSHDIGSVTHLILWDEIQRLERLQK